MIHCLNIFYVAIFISSCECFFLNNTGATFPLTVYQESTFAYQFADPSNQVHYFGAGSTTGKCNIMGYWHTGNTDPSTAQWRPSSAGLTKDTNICTDKCTVALCGNDSSKYPRFDKATRRPLVSFSGSDALLLAADYKAFPDLQMFPAVAGAVVPIFNIPEIKNTGGNLILSRTTIANIFLGSIVMWNDPAVVADQASNPAVQKIMSNLNQTIKPCVRTDSSGTTAIFTTALSNFDPVTFGTQVTAGERGAWCGKLTDEIQVITITKCTGTNSAKLIQLTAVTSKYRLASIAFQCDDSTAAVKKAFESVYGSGNILVSRDIIAANASYTFSIGYWGSAYTTKNQYEPAIASSGSAAVKITTLQEGGYFNSHYNSSAYFVTLESQSIFVNSTPGLTYQFTITNPNTNAASPNFGTVDLSLGNVIDQIKSTLNAIAPYLVRTVTATSRGTFMEYKLTFNTTKPNPSRPKVFLVNAVSVASSNVACSTFLHASNYPLFYDWARPQGIGKSGKYTCYKKNGNMKPWSYYTGFGNLGVVAEVLSQPYSIGYSVLQDAKSLNLPTASMINRAGTVVQATSDSVAFAVMEKGGNLNSQFNADLSDGASSLAWPLAGYTYFLIRGNDHAGSCAMRVAAMTFLYNFYHSTTVQQIAARLGFTTLPDFIRDIIVTQLVNTAMCRDGSYALAAFRKASTPLLATSAVSTTISTYITSYYNIDPGTIWSVSGSEDSRAILSTFNSNKAKYVGAFTMFSSKGVKTAQYQKFPSNAMITAAFAHVAIIPIYHINAYSAKATTPLRVTAEILAGIYTGTIQYWNDTRIQAANAAMKSHLPFARINVAVRIDSCDVNELFTRYLGIKSSLFQTMYGLPVGEGVSDPNFPSKLPAAFTLLAADNVNIDAKVTFYDNSIGYYLQIGSPNANVASFCADSKCSNPISPANIKSLQVCQQDLNTFVNMPSYGVMSYDLMTSNVTGCYPILGTVDYTVPAQKDATCPLGSNGIAYKRVQFSSWLFSSPVLVQPLVSMNAAGAPNSLRNTIYKQICNIQCDAYLGYTYCNYRDCTWKAGDYKQVVSACDPSTMQRTVSYELIDPTNQCIRNPATGPPSATTIVCDHVESESAYGITAYFLAALGILITGAWLAFAVYMRNDKRMARNQPMYVYAFVSGAMLLNASIVTFIGPNTDTLCTAQQWMSMIPVTFVYGPLVIKLNNVDRLNKDPKLSKILNAPSRLIKELAVLLIFDLIILGVGTGLNAFKAVTVNTTYVGLLQTVADVTCDNGISNFFYLALVGYKAIVFLFGMVEAVCTWHVTTEISEAKQFAVAVAVGGICFLVGVFLSFTNNDAVILIRVLSIFMCATAASMIIMLPKFQPSKKSTHNTKSHGSSGGAESAISKASESKPSQALFERRKDSRIAVDAPKAVEARKSMDLVTKSTQSTQSTQPVTDGLVTEFNPNSPRLKEMDAKTTPQTTNLQVEKDTGIRKQPSVTSGETLFHPRHKIDEEDEKDNDGFSVRAKPGFKLPNADDMVQDFNPNELDQK